MKFGKLESIENVDFTLPNDHLSNFEAITPEKDGIAKLYTGATSWINPQWKNVIYPSKAKKKDFLYDYSRQFNGIELNGTHYRTPTDKSIETWVKETPSDFRFCPKILQAISHRKDMLHNRDLVNNFVVQLSKLEDKLGATFIQLPPYFTHANLAYLEKFLEAWPIEMKLAVEVRNHALHDNIDQFNDYLFILKKYNCIPVITDVAGARSLMHMAVNIDTVFIRWVGNDLHTSDLDRIDEWVIRLSEWAMKGVKEIYFMLHEPENEKTPKIANYMASQIKNYPYIAHRGPKLINEMPNLFS